MGISADTLRIQLNTKFWLGKCSCIWQATITKPWSREGRTHLLGPPRRKLWCRFLLLLPNISAHLGITAMFRKVMLRKELKMGSGANTHRSVQYLSSIHRSPSLFPRRLNCLSFLRCSRTSSPYSQALRQLCLNSVDCPQEAFFLLQENLYAASPIPKSLVLKQSCSAPITKLFGTTQAFHPKSWGCAPYGLKSRCEAQPRKVVI